MPCFNPKPYKSQLYASLAAAHAPCCALPAPQSKHAPLAFATVLTTILLLQIVHSASCWSYIGGDRNREGAAGERGSGGTGGSGETGRRGKWAAANLSLQPCCASLHALALPLCPVLSLQLLMSPFCTMPLQT